MDLISCQDWDPGTLYKMQCIDGAHHIGGLDSPTVWPLLLIIDCSEYSLLANLGMLQDQSTSFSSFYSATEKRLGLESVSSIMQETFENCNEWQRATRNNYI